jgi:diguanylate cyclase (GGDEF)-like protein/PAS domain S-box-containing protein
MELSEPDTTCQSPALHKPVAAACAQPRAATPNLDPVIFRHAFAQAPAALALCDLQGRFLFANRMMCDLFGCDEGELQARDFDSIIHPQDVQASRQALRKLHPADCRCVNFETRLRHKSARAIHAVVKMAWVCDDAGRSLHIQMHVQDVSAQRRLALLETDRRQVLEMVAQDQPLPSILHHLVRLIERQMPGMWGCVMVLHEGTIRPFAPSLPEKLAAAILRRPVSFAAQLARPMGKGTPTRIADVETDPAWEGLRAEAREAGLKCCWAVTIASGDAVTLGLLAVFAPENRPPTDAEAALLDIATRLATIAVEHHLTTRQLAYLVRHDALTGLPNRVLFEDRLHHALATARRSGRPLALLEMDLNRFKQINDTMGHQAGDAMLQHFANCVRRCLREADTLARVGGDEFMLILPDLSNGDYANQIASRIRDTLAASPIQIAGRAMVVSCSIGIALHPADGEDALLLQRAADAAMYREKERGRSVRA